MANGKYSTKDIWFKLGEVHSDIKSIKESLKEAKDTNLVEHNYFRDCVGDYKNMKGQAIMLIVMVTSVIGVIVSVAIKFLFG